MDDVIDLQGCECCGKYHPIEEMSSIEDGWICTSCEAEWRAEFDACDHAWEPSTNVYGEAGRFCKKCCCFVVEPTNEDV